MFDYMKEYEPREALFEALGRVESLRMLEPDTPKADVLEDVAHFIKWVLKNSTMYKAPEVSND